MANTILIKILADASQMEREFRAAGDSGEKMGKKLGGSLKKYAKLGAAGAAIGGVAVVTKQLFASVDAAKESQKAEVRLGQAFDAANVKAKDRARAQETINKVSKRAALDDEDLSDSLASITRATGSVVKGQKGIALAANIARGRNISLAAATKLVEKAYLGSDTAFKRVGVVVPKVTRSYDMLKSKVGILTDRYKKAKGPLKDKIKAQIEDIKQQYASAKAADKAATAQSAISKATKLFAGSSEKYGKTAAGAQEKLSVAFENLQERVGMKLLPVLTKLSLWGVRFLDWSEKNWPRFSKAIKDMWQKAKPFIDNLVDRIQDVAKIVKGVVQIIKGIRDGDWSLVWKGFKTVVVNELKLIYDTFLALPAKIVKALGRRAWSGLSSVGASIKNAIIGGLEGIAQGVVNILVGAINRVIKLANSAIGKINKVSPFPDIPKISEVTTPGSRTSPQRVQPGTRSSGPRDRGDTSRTTAGVQHVTINVNGARDPVETGRAVLREIQRTNQRTATPRRGPNAGTALATG